MFGYFAEIIIVLILSFFAYRIIKHRYRNCCGEIDIIAIRGNSIFFIEVKARRNKDKNIVIDLLALRQQKRIKKTADYFLSINNPKYRSFNPFFVFYRISFFSIVREFF